MFGFSFSELVVVVIVALVVIGPKDLPKMLRKLGQWAGKLRRMASDLRAQSGIDDALRTEGLADDINEIRKLARGELDDVRRAASIDANLLAGGAAATTIAQAPAGASYSNDFYVVREREYPRDGADAYGALPDNAIVYAEGLPKSKLGRDPLYVLGDENGELPPEPEKKPEEPLVEGEAHGAAETAEAKADSAGSQSQSPPADDPAKAPVAEGDRPEAR